MCDRVILLKADIDPGHGADRIKVVGQDYLVAQLLLQGNSFVWCCRPIHMWLWVTGYRLQVKSLSVLETNTSPL
jgi:hypothetical protein